MLRQIIITDASRLMNTQKHQGDVTELITNYVEKLKHWIFNLRFAFFHLIRYLLLYY